MSRGASCAMYGRMGNYLVVGDVVNRRFRLDEILGRGGQGEVFAAHDLELERRVAIKVMLKQDDDAYQALFLKEAKAVARLDHPNIVRIYDLGRSGDQPYIVMEHLNGESLAELMRDTEPSVTMLSTSFPRSPRRWLPLTRKVSSTATSNPPTSS